MQDFHHNYIENENGDKPEILLKDVDAYKIGTENVYEGF